MPKNVEAPLSRYLIKSSVHMPINVIILLLRYLIKSKVHMPMNDTAILSHFVIIKVHMPMNVIIFLPIYLISDIMNSLQFLICIFFMQMEAKRWLPAKSTHPPALIPGYGSRLYPQVALLNPYLDVQGQLLKIANSWREREIKQLYDVKAADHLLIRKKYADRATKKPYCCTCSEIELEDPESREKYIRYHQHDSSKQFRIEACLDHYGQYLCINCETAVHHYKSSTRVPLLVSSSTLHCWTGRRFIDVQYAGNPFHLDHLTIPGATLSVLQQAVYSEYRKCDIPIDILLVGGLNDILKDHSIQEIMCDLGSFKDMVQSWDHRNTFAISTLPFPPKISYLGGDPAYHKRALLTGGSDKFFLLNAVTSRIIDLNNQGNRPLHTSRAPRFHTWGLRNPTDNNLPYGACSLGSLGQHRSAQWREEDSLDQLHLNNHVRVRMGKSVIKYFTIIYGLNQEVQLEEQPDHEHFVHEALPQAVDPEPVPAPLHPAEVVPEPQVLPLAALAPVAAEGLVQPAPDTVPHGPDLINPVPAASDLKLPAPALSLEVPVPVAAEGLVQDHDFYLEINSGHELLLDQSDEDTHGSHSPNLDLLESD